MGKGRCATILINNMVASTHRVPPLLLTTPLLFDMLVCWLDILFFSHSAPQTRANTPSVEICRLAQQPGLHYGILFTLQPSTILFSRGIAMATSLRRAVTMGGKSYMLSMFDILLSKYSVRGSSNWLLNKINNIFFCCCQQGLKAAALITGKARTGQKPETRVSQSLLAALETRKEWRSTQCKGILTQTQILLEQPESQGLPGMK